MMKLWNELLNLFFPRFCLLCHRPLIDGEEQLCLHCLCNLSYTYFDDAEVNEAAQLFMGKVLFEKATAMFYYQKGGAVQKLIHVVDSKGIPVEYATIILLQDSVQKAGAVADSSGGFRMEAQAGSYDLVAQCVGYESLHKKVSLPLSESATLVLATSSLALNEVVVQARSIERKADRFVMSVQPASGKNGTELLAQAPGVWLTGSSVSINGASGTKVFVDSREIKLSGEELVNYLRSLRSEDIRRVEVVPVAGSEYDANAQGGVILISLRRRPDNGMRLALSVLNFAVV